MKPRYRTAVCLDYQQENEQAPTVGAKGEYFSADEIVRIARRYGVPVIERPQLARALSDIEVDQQIPRSLFEAVAALLVSVERVLGLRKV